MIRRMTPSELLRSGSRWPGIGCREKRLEAGVEEVRACHLRALRPRSQQSRHRVCRKRAATRYRGAVDHIVPERPALLTGKDSGESLVPRRVLPQSNQDATP
jgi:hypothetical protein